MSISLKALHNCIKAAWNSYKLLLKSEAGGSGLTLTTVDVVAAAAEASFSTVEEEVLQLLTMALVRVTDEEEGDSDDLPLATRALDTPLGHDRDLARPVDEEDEVDDDDEDDVDEEDEDELEIGKDEMVALSGWCSLLLKGLLANGLDDAIVGSRFLCTRGEMSL